MTGSVWLGGLFAVTSLVAAGAFVAGLFVGGLFVAGSSSTGAVRSRVDRSAYLAHALMSLGMAGMFSPWGDPVPAAAGAVVFGLIGAWFAARHLRRYASSRHDGLHLVVGPVAMTLMYLAMGHGGGTPEPDAGGSGHAGHGSVLTSDGGSLPLTVLTLGLAAYFVWHAWTSAAPAGEPPRLRSSIRVAHVVMSVLMAAMLLGVP